MFGVGKHGVKGLRLAVLVAVLVAGCGLSAVSALAASDATLPDGRVVELVSTSGNAAAGEPAGAGEPYTPASPFISEVTGLVTAVHPFQAAEDGEAVTYIGEPPATGGTGETGLGEGDQWLATRSAQGWKTGAITPASTTAQFQYQVYQGFTPDLTPDLTTGFLEGGELQPAQPLGTAAPEKSCRSLYTHELAPTAGAFDALFIKGDGAEYVPCGHPLFAGATADDSQVIFQSEAPLTENAEAATEVPATREGHLGASVASGEPCTFGCNLYDSVGGQLRLVNVVDGKTVPNATFGGYPGESKNGSTDFSNAISTNGSDIFWTDTQEQKDRSYNPDFGHVYVLEHGTSTVPVSGANVAEYWTATPDGRYAYYTENSELWRFDTESQERVAVTPADYSGTGTGNLVGPGAGKGTTTAGSNLVTGVVTSSGAFAVGQTVKGVSGEGCGSGCIPEGATITAVDPGTGTLTLSENATGSETNFGIAASFNEIRSVDTTHGQFLTGEHIFGVGIPAGTTIVEVTPTTLKLSSSILASGTGVALYAGGSEVQGVIGTNQTGADGAYLYFVADGVLSTNDNAQGEAASAGQPNLYLLRAGNPTPIFIATLSPEDNQIRVSTVADQHGGDWKANLGERTAEVTPDGRHLLFQSVRQLTGYDNASSVGPPSMEVFAFSADDEGLVCASCNPTGAIPTVNEKELLVTKLPVSAESNVYMHRWISSEGTRVFFDSLQPLVPGDTNGVQDVYEWESEGEGTCTAQDASPLNHGCVFLLSGGYGQNYSFLVDADASGENVFFEYEGPLGQVQVPSDQNQLYDARVNGGFPQVSQACTGTGCQGVPPAPPIFATPSSATFSGAGNPPPPAPAKTVVKSLTRAEKLASALKACKRDKRKSRREGCEKQAHKRYGAKKATKAKRAGNERRTQS